MVAVPKSGHARCRRMAHLPMAEPMTEPQLTRSIDEPDAATYSLGERVMRIVATPVQLVAVLLFPDRAMPRAVARERGMIALLAVMLCAGLGAWVIGSRIDTTSAVLAEETQ